MIEEDLEVAIKVVVVGNGAVGKSSLIQRYCKGTFTKDYKKTIGVDFLERQLQIGGEETRLMLWDTAGQEEFDAITKAYYRGAHVCVVAFSCVDRESFLALESWKKKVEDEVDEIVMCLVQNKIDLIEEATMTPEEVDAVAKRLKLKLFRTSVKENFNVDKVFEYMASKHLDKRAKEMNRNKKVNAAAPVVLGTDVEKPSSEASPVPTSTEEQSFQIQPSKSRVKKKNKASCVLI